MSFQKWATGGVNVSFMQSKNKKVLITGSGGLSRALAYAYSECNVFCTSRSQSYYLESVETWGAEFLDYDVVFNCAYSDLGQIKVLKYFSDHWKNDPTKTIVNIGSIVADYPRSEVANERDFFEYRYSKQSLQQAFSDIAKTYNCDLRLINLGPIETDMTQHIPCAKLKPISCAVTIRKAIEETKFKRIDFWE